MKIAMISFTGNGWKLEKSLAKELKKEGHQVIEAVKCKGLESEKAAVKCSAGEWNMNSSDTGCTDLYRSCTDCRTHDRILYRIKDI